MQTYSRRLFLIAAGSSSAGLVIGIAELARPSRAKVTSDDALNQWISISPDGTVSIRVNRVDMGQGAQTGLAQIVADELDADWTKLSVEMAPLTKEYMPADGEYHTGGSQSIRFELDAMADAGATARALLVAAAAVRLKTTPNSLRTKNGEVFEPSTGRRILYGDLASDAAKLPIPPHVARKASADRLLIGKSVGAIGSEKKVTGSAVYGIDIRIPGMLSATVTQCPYIGGTLVHVDEASALSIPGVHSVVKFESAVIVTAEDFWAAKQGLSALTPRWKIPDNAIASDEAMFESLRTHIGAPSAVVVTLDKDTNAAISRCEAAFAGAHKIVEAEYQLPLLSHAQMEPMNATAKVDASSCEIWAPMQTQSKMRNDVAKALGLPSNSIVLHSTLIGGGFGRRRQTDFGVLAARVARHVARPVQLIWTREEDMTHGFYRPASIGRVRAALNKQLMIDALDYQGATTNDTAIGGFARNYKVPDVIVRQTNVSLAVPVGDWRSVDPSITIFLIESLVDEIAGQVGIDPLQYRRRLLAADPRGLRTLNAAAEMANWGNVPSGHYQGVAFLGSSHWGTAVAEIVELSIDGSKRIEVHRVYCAIDPGTAINPQLIKAQVEGGILLGLSAALGETITVKDGRIVQKNFDSYSPLRLRSAPAIDVSILESHDVAIGGVGEPPVPPAAPALVNAICAATGKRIRRLPLSASGYSY